MSWNELSLKDKADYIKESVNNGIYNLSDIKNRYNIYAEGGYKPSESIKKRITNWEGSSMRTNRSFQAEANDFNRVIPASIRSKLSQQQLDALYSYGYNVGMGNLKKRVLPTLNNYVQGKASNEDVQKSMWASKDNELRGLTTRRNVERSLFGGKYQTVYTGTGGTPHNYGYTAKSNINTDANTKVNPYQLQNEVWQGKNYLGAYKGLQLSMNDIIGKTKETDIDNLFSTGTGPIISMDNLLSIGNNTVAPVQPDYSYTKSLLSDFDSDLNSNMFGNGGKISKTYQGDLSHLKDVGYQKWRANLPANLREETPDYNLYEAYKSGAKPRLESDGFYHLPSRDPRTNKILKKATHPTYGMALREDAIEGYLPVYNNGETYTYPLPWIKAYGGKINRFDEGGNLNFIDADNRRSNILLHTEDGNLYDSAGNNYTQSYLDEENVPIIKGTMPRNTRQYYDPNTTMDFINAVIAPISNFSPSNIVGSIREARDYNTFMNSFMNQDNTGFFTREYAKEHPYISNIGNFLGDLALFSFPYNKASKINNIESLGKAIKSLTPSNKLEAIDTALATGIGTIPGDILVADSYNRTKEGKEATLIDNLEFYGGMGLSALGAVLGHDFSIGAFNLGKSAIGRTAYDVLFKPTQTLQAAKNGLYHINKEVTANKVGQAFRDGVYSGFDDYYKNYANPIQQYFIEGNSPSIKINTRNPNDRKIIVRLHPREDELDEYAHFSNRFISPSGLDEYVTFATKSPTTNLPMMPSLKYYKGTGAHESLHGQLFNTIGPNPLSKYDVEAKYFRGNPDIGIDFSSWENEASTNWSKSIEELEAEFFNYKAKNNLEGKFKDLTKTQQQEFIDLASKRFKVSKNGIRNGMSTLNKYFDTVMPKVK
nr:MAG TPA: Lysozyme [Crassvirales sp.]